MAGGRKRALIGLMNAAMRRIGVETSLARAVRLEGDSLCIGDQRIVLADQRSVSLFAMGKAAYPMVDAIAPWIRHDELTCLASGVGELRARLPRVQTFSGGHPDPNAASRAAARAMLGHARELGHADLALFLISGGGSAMVEEPLDPVVTLDEMRDLNRRLVTCGAGIVEVNAVRKHLSSIKGGRLAAAAHPAQQITLYVSDVPHSHPSAVASGPSMPDETTVEQACAVAARWGLDRGDSHLAHRLRERDLPETPKPGADVFARSSWHCLMDNDEAVARLAECARELGWIVEERQCADDETVEQLAERLVRALDAIRPGQQPVAIVCGGEPACPVPAGSVGQGGRNLAFALECVPRIAGKNVSAIGFATDGIDGNSPAAGAVVDGDSLARIREAGLGIDSAREAFDSYALFDALDDTIVSGPSGNNVSDLHVLVRWPD